MLQFDSPFLSATLYLPAPSPLFYISRQYPPIPTTPSSPSLRHCTTLKISFALTMENLSLEIQLTLRSDDLTSANADEKTAKTSIPQSQPVSDKVNQATKESVEYPVPCDECAYRKMCQLRGEIPPEERFPKPVRSDGPDPTNTDGKTPTLQSQPVSDKTNEAKDVIYHRVECVECDECDECAFRKVSQRIKGLSYEEKFTRPFQYRPRRLKYF